MYLTQIPVMLLTPYCILNFFSRWLCLAVEIMVRIQVELRLESRDQWAWCQAFLSVSLHLSSWRAGEAISCVPALPTQSPAWTAEGYQSMHSFCHICQSLEDASGNMLRNLKWQKWQCGRELIFQMFIEREGSVGVWLTSRHLHLRIWIWTSTPALVIMLITHCRWETEAQRN